MSPVGGHETDRDLNAIAGRPLSGGRRLALANIHAVATDKSDTPWLLIDYVDTCSYIGFMRTVGIRELKNSLSEYIRRVRAGETVLVTDRGEIVAELTAPGANRSDPSMPPGLAALARRGLATVGCAGNSDLYRPLPRKRRGAVSAARLLDEERGSR
jgi:antitoxin (DNA-binding transcriptional repressor) of toxin-antitoxin stability system